MDFSIETGIPVLTVFIQGIVSFLSPCVLPLLPIYVGYFASGAKVIEEDGTIRYPRGKIFVNTVFFVLGISFVFFLLGFGFSALGEFFSDYRTWFVRISGLIMLLFGLYQMGLVDKPAALEREHRFSVKLDRFAMGPVPAFILGFTFSFSWTPCIGPVLGGVLLMAGSSGTTAMAFLLIGVYTIGFILPFLAVGLFTGTVLEFFKKHQNVVRYTVKIGAFLLIIMGLMTFAGLTNNMSGFFAGLGDNSGLDSGGNGQSQSAEDMDEEDMGEEDSQDENSDAAPDFTLTDQYGNTHTLSEYEGKTVFLNFWATWCPPCREEMPGIQSLYEEYGENSGDVIVLGVAGPNMGREGSAEDVAQFLSDNGYTFPVVMDSRFASFNNYAVTAFPTTALIDGNGNVFRYIQGGLPESTMKTLVKDALAVQ